VPSNDGTAHPEAKDAPEPNLEAADSEAISEFVR
jgi:hypothetical protein